MCPVLDNRSWLQRIDGLNFAKIDIGEGPVRWKFQTPRLIAGRVKELAACANTISVPVSTFRSTPHFEMRPRSSGRMCPLPRLMPRSRHCLPIATGPFGRHQ